MKYFEAKVNLYEWKEPITKKIIFHLEIVSNFQDEDELLLVAIKDSDGLHETMLTGKRKCEKEAIVL